MMYNISLFHFTEKRIRNCTENIVIIQTFAIVLKNVSYFISIILISIIFYFISWWDVFQIYSWWMYVHFCNTMNNVQCFEKSEITFLFCDKIWFISVYLKHRSWLLFCLRCLSFAFWFTFILWRDNIIRGTN